MSVCHIHIHTQKRVGLESLFSSLVFHSVVSGDFLYF
jgi:hypothetical protein